MPNRMSTNKSDKQALQSLRENDTCWPQNHEAPLVSVCMITYNHRNFIAQAIDSVLMQEVDFPVEIIIHDDCSTDGTADIVRNYAQRFPQLIRPTLQTENQYSQGKKPLLNNFKEARGKYLALLDGDDAWTDPHKLQKQTECLEKHPEHILCYGNVTCVNEKDEVLEKRKIAPEHCRGLSQEEIISCQRVIPMGSVMLRYHDILKNMPKVYFKVLNGDTFIFALLAQYGSAAYVDFTPSLYRQHAGGIYSAKTDCQKSKARLNTYRHLYSSLAPQFRPILAKTIIAIHLSLLKLLWSKRKYCQFSSSYFYFLSFALPRQRILCSIKDALLPFELLKDSIKKMFRRG